MSTSRWSPTFKVPSIDGVGTTNACSRVVVPNSSSMNVTVHSAMKCREAAADLAGIICKYARGGGLVPTIQ